MRSKSVVASLLAAAGLALPALAGTGQVIITEIMYNPSGTDEGQEWVEITNVSAAPVDVSGWYLRDEDGRSTGFAPGTILQPGEVAVVGSSVGGVLTTTGGNAPAYTVTQADWDTAWGPGIRVIFIDSFTNYPGATPPIVSLSNLAQAATALNEILELRDATDVVVDEVNYQNALQGWPDDNGNGSIQLAREFYTTTGNDNGRAWRLSQVADAIGSARQIAVPSGGAFPGGTEASVASPGRAANFQTADCNANSIPDVQEIADGLVTDLNGNGVPDACEPDCNGNGTVDDVEFAQDWRIDRNLNRIIDFCEINSAGGTGGVGGLLDTNSNGILDLFDNQPSVMISEIMYNPAGSDEPQEWVEIYNFGTTPVDISGWYMQDIERPTPDPASGTIPAGTVMAPGEVIVLIPGSGSAAILPTHPATFRTAWNVPASVRIISINPWQSVANDASFTQEVRSLLNDDGQLVDVANYQSGLNGWPTCDGVASIYVKPGFFNKSANDNPESWGLSTLNLDAAYASSQLTPFTDGRGLGAVGTPGFVFQGPAQQPVGTVIITEIMNAPNSNGPAVSPATSGNGTRNEWVEITNITNACVDISGFHLRDEDGFTQGVPAGTLLAPRESVVLLTLGHTGTGAGIVKTEVATAIADFKAAWGQNVRVIPLDGWNGSLPLPNLNNIANDPNAVGTANANELLTLRNAQGVPVDIVRFDDIAPWPADSSTVTTPGIGDGWSIYFRAAEVATLSHTANDDGNLWSPSARNIDSAYQNTLTTVFNGNDLGSPGVVAGITPGAPCVVACGASDVSGPGQTIGADGQLTADDIIVFIGWFFAADARADVAGSGQVAGADGQFTADDIIIFINRFFAGC